MGRLGVQLPVDIPQDKDDITVLLRDIQKKLNNLVTEVNNIKTSLNDIRGEESYLTLTEIAEILNRIEDSIY